MAHQALTLNEDVTAGTSQSHLEARMGLKNAADETNEGYSFRLSEADGTNVWMHCMQCAVSTLTHRTRSSPGRASIRGAASCYQLVRTTCVAFLSAAYTDQHCFTKASRLLAKIKLLLLL